MRELHSDTKGALFLRPELWKRYMNPQKMRNSSVQWTGFVRNRSSTRVSGVNEKYVVFSNVKQMLDM